MIIRYRSKSGASSKIDDRFIRRKGFGENDITACICSERKKEKVLNPNLEQKLKV